MVQWLKLSVPTAGGLGSNPGWGNKTPQTLLCGQKKKKKKGSILIMVRQKEEKPRYSKA